jgi:hypothetical protein
MKRAINGIINPNKRFATSAPPMSAMVAMGVKLGQCGINRNNAAIAIAVITRMNLG